MKRYENILTYFSAKKVKHCMTSYSFEFISNDERERFQSCIFIDCCRWN